MILQYAYRPILNFIYDKITFRLNERTRKILLFLCFFAIFAVQFAAQYIFKFQGLNRGIRDYFICLMMGIIILASADRKLEIIKWNLWTYVPFTLTGLLLLIASLDHEMGPAYQAFPLAMLVAFMCLFYVWGNRKDYEVLFDAVAGAYALFAAILLVVCIFKYPLDYFSSSSYGLGYAPFSINPNGTAKVFIVGIISAGYFLEKNVPAWLVGGVIFVASGFCVIVYQTRCRAGILCLACLILVVIIFSIIKLKKQRSIFYFIKKMILMSACILVGCCINYFLLTTISNGIYDVNSKAEVNTIQQQEVNKPTDKKVVDHENALKRERQIANLIEKSKKEIYLNSKLHQMDIFMAGRISIWNIYFQNMTWRGSSELMFYDTEYAHNQYIELSYKAGIPTGILYLIFNLIAGILALRMFIRRKDAVGLLSLSAFIVFFIISMLDTGVLPFERGFIFLYYITLTPLFFRKDKNKTITKD